MELKDNTSLVELPAIYDLRCSLTHPSKEKMASMLEEINHSPTTVTDRQ